MQLDDSSSEGSSSSDEDFDFLFLEAAFPEPRLLGSRLNIENWLLFYFIYRSSTSK